MPMLKDIKGSTVIEMAIALPILLLIIMGSLEYSLIMFAQSTLDEGVSQAAREGSTQFTGTGTTWGVNVNSCTTLSPPQCPNSAQAMIQAHMNGVPGSLATVTTCAFNAANNYTCTYDNNTGGPGDFVIYKATYSWTILTPFMRTFLGSNGIFTMNSETLVQNENCATYPCVTQ